MRDIFIFLVVMALVFASFARPWLMTLTYLYIDLIQPQRLSYYLFRGVPISLIIAIAAVLLFIADKKKNLRINFVQVLMAIFVLWFTFTAERAIIQDSQVWFKWNSAWKAVLFGGIYLPMVLATRRRIEAAVYVLVMCVALVTVSGSLKTLAGGGGYQELPMIVEVNSGLYESSTIGAVGIAIVPLILYLLKHSEFVPKTIWSRMAAAGLCLSSVLIIVGTEARTGLVCMAILAAMYWVRAKRKLVFAAVALAVLVASIPLLPESFVHRMTTILHPTEEVSAETRLDVWNWAFRFIKTHPLGGGFRVNRLTEITTTTPVRNPDGSIKKYISLKQEARAFHSSYIEVLAEHGWPGLILYLGIIGGTLAQLGAMMRRYAKATLEDRWRHDLAQALFRALGIYAIGGAFVGLSTQTTLYTIIAIGLAHMQVDATRRIRAVVPSRSFNRFRNAGRLPSDEPLPAV